MTNDQYGTYQTPSSRPPEPPYRADSGSVHGEQMSQQGAQGGYGEGQAYQGAPEADFSGFDRTAEMNGASAQQTERYNAPRSGSTESMPYGSAGAAQPRSYEARPVQNHAQPRAPKQASAGKTFLFGFLGALVACALAFGGFMLWYNGRPTSNAASTTIGTTDSSVINAVEEGQTLAEAVAAKALPSVVAVYNYQNQQTTGFYGRTSQQTAANTEGLQLTGMGSGVVISSDGYILTNYHVVEGAGKLTVKVGQEERDATYIGGDASSDVAVIKVENMNGLSPVDIGDSDKLVIGEWVMTVGAPLGLEQSVATGVVSATNRSTIMSDSSSSDAYSYYNSNQPTSYTYYPNMIQTDAVINPGNSGGALVDADGKLIGINTMISSYSGDYAGVGFAIPVNYAIAIANDVIAGKTPTHAMLGVSISSVNANNAQRYNLSSTTGAYINSIAEGTGAAQSDLKEGDIITQVDDTKIESTTDVTLEVREHNPGDTVTVTVNRNGQTLEIPVVLSSDENASKSNDSNNQGQDQGQGQGQGRGNSYGYGGGGYSTDQLEELLRMLGM